MHRLLLIFLGVAQLAFSELISSQDRCEAVGDDINPAFTIFDSNITTDGPLMWTVVSGTTKVSSSKHAWRYWRDFYISTPPSLSLTQVDNFSGCGLYFHNITSALQLPSNFTDYNSFTCDTVMSTQCQDDLLKQALDDYNLLSGIVEPNATDYFTCQHMGQRFASRSVPASCNLQQHTWGDTSGSYIAGRGLVDAAITGPDQKCFINNDTAHNDLFGGSFHSEFQKGDDASKAFQNGTTPVVTMFFTFPKPGQEAPFLPQPELHLTCLKSIHTAQEQAKINGVQGQTERLYSSLVMGALVVSALLFGFV